MWFYVRWIYMRTMSLEISNYIYCFHIFILLLSTVCFITVVNGCKNSDTKFFNTEPSIFSWIVKNNWKTKILNLSFRCVLGNIGIMLNARTSLKIDYSVAYIRYYKPSDTTQCCGRQPDCVWLANGSCFLLGWRNEHLSWESGPAPDLALASLHLCWHPRYIPGT